MPSLIFSTALSTANSETRNQKPLAWCDRVAESIPDLDIETGEFEHPMHLIMKFSSIYIEYIVCLHVYDFNH